MMVTISNFIRALGSGGLGGVANVVLLCIIWQVIDGPDYSHAFLYKQVTWGGIWGLAFLIPVLSNNWWLKGMVWGTAATAVALLVFKVAPISVPTVIIGLVVNAGAWGLAASWLFYKFAEPAGS